ncbi:MAG: PEGA domain-containing protein [Polyangiales bacterium]
MNRRTVRRNTASIVLIVCAASAPALAQTAPTPEPPVSERDAARARALPHFQEGLRLAEAQQWAEALAEFNRARSEFATTNVLFNVGYCQRALGQYVEALGTLRQFVASSESAAHPRRDEAVSIVTELEARIGRVRVRVRDDLRAGVELSIDGRSVRLEPNGELSIAVNPGSHTVQARHAGFVALFEDRAVRPGEIVTIEVALRRLPTRLIVRANVDGSAVLLDGASMGSAPFEAEVEPGRRVLEVRSAGYISHRSTLNLVTGTPARITVDLQREPVSVVRRWWFWTAIGAGVVGTATAAALIAMGPPPYDGGSLRWVIGDPGR